MNRIVSILMASLIIIFTSIGLLFINFIHEETEYGAQEGILDLTQWDYLDGKPIKLNGKWEFYPDIFIDPVYTSDEKPSFDVYADIKRLIYVPGDWGEGTYPKGSSNAAGTYRLIVNLPADMQYGIKTSTIRTAARIFMNGTEVAAVGRPSLEKGGHSAGSRYKMAFIESANKRIELVLHVSSYDYRTGGIIKPIKFGAFDRMIELNNRARAIDGFAISVCIILSVYFFLQWMQRRHERYFLYFSGAGFFMSIYLSTMNEQLFTLIYDYEFTVRIKMQIAMMLLVTLCFLKFIQYFFAKHTKRKPINILTGILLLLLLLIFNDINNVLLIPVGVAQSLIAFALMASYIYILWVLFRNIYVEDESKGYILIIASALFSYWIAIICKMLFEMETGLIPVVLIMVIQIGISLLMSHRFQLNHQKTKMLSEKLVMYDKLKDDFLARTSHELRTPLHLMINLSKQMLEGRKGTMNLKQQEDLILIHNESKRLARMVDDLMDMSSIEKGQVKIITGPVEPYHAVQGIMDEMKLLLPEKSHILLINNIDKNFPPIKADSDRFKQVIYNLLHNAIKYTAKGTVSVSATIPAGMALFRVEDTGRGIEKEHINNIFDGRYRNDTEYHGYGLGLQVVKRLVEIHGGIINVDSQLGKGTCFYFTLPLYQESDDEKVMPVDTTRAIGSRTGVKGDNTVLIVDDEPSNLKVMSDIVEGMGSKVLTAERGSKVMAILAQNEVDLVILDIMLPDMSGNLVCKMIRNNYSMSELPILILTASGRITDLMKSFEYGANDFLKKPADGDELMARIQSLLMMKTSVEEGMIKEYQYFYSQISPHFLYNTLNTIIGLTYHDQESTRNALYNLSIYLRSKMDLYKQKSLIPLEEEIDLITAYLEIEKMRHQNRLSIEYNIEENLSAMIPPLTLQPLVENAVLHSLTVKNTVRIVVSAMKMSSGNISIFIEDNGPGMTEEKLKEIMSESNGSFGLSNVIKKIKIDRRYSITIKSEYGEGTKITILLPEAKQDENYSD